MRADGERLIRQCERVRRMTDRRERTDRTRAERGCERQVPLIYKNFLARSVQQIFVAAIFSKSPFPGISRRRSAQIVRTGVPGNGDEERQEKISRKREKEVRDGVRSGDQSE